MFVFVPLVLHMMMEDSVRPSIQATMVGGTVNLVERSVLESCRSLFSDYCVVRQVFNMVFPFCLISDSIFSFIDVNAIIF